jgi:NAD(P)-dependent dehydrogenase (short-subunit alcohol dehydrogenase family)
MSEGIVLVTGGSRGIGAATATLLAEQGKKVVITDIQPEPIAGGAILWPAPFDVASEGGVVAGVADIEKAHGPISGLVNAAGIFGKMHTLEKVRMEQWDREVNIDSAVPSWWRAASACEWHSVAMAPSSMSRRSPA